MAEASINAASASHAPVLPASNAELLQNLPEVAKSRESLHSYPKNYFPTNRQVLQPADTIATWVSEPEASLTRLAALCQSVLTKAGVYEIQLPVAIPWMFLVSHLVHRRHPKVTTNKLSVAAPKTDPDKPTPRSCGTPLSFALTCAFNAKTVDRCTSYQCAGCSRKVTPSDSHLCLLLLWWALLKGIVSP